MGHVTWPSLAFSGRDATSAVRCLGGELITSADALKVLEKQRLSGPSTAGDPRDGTLLFLQSAEAADIGRLADLRACLILLPPGAEAAALGRNNAVLFARNPKYAYARLLNALLPLSAQRGNWTEEPAPGVRAARGFSLMEGVRLEPFVTIGPDASIGRGTYVMKGAVIGPRVRIGENCVIGEGAVLGSPGFGFAFDGDRPPVRIPQVGGVVIGDRVEVGVLSCVDAGTIDPTVLEDDVKINSHVHIAHNCRIGRGSILGAAASISGSTWIGERCWLGPGAVVRNKVSVGAGATVGMGAVVVKNVPQYETVTGIPARSTGNIVPWYESARGTP